MWGDGGGMGTHPNQSTGRERCVLNPVQSPYLQVDVDSLLLLVLLLPILPQLLVGREDFVAHRGDVVP